jgi:cell division protein FtsL
MVCVKPFHLVVEVIMSRMHRAPRTSLHLYAIEIETASSMIYLVHADRHHRNAGR